MKPIAIGACFIVLFGAGIGGAYWYISRGSSLGPAPSPQAERGEAAHGKAVEIPANATLCARHRIPEVVCPFCNSALIEERGHCGEHDVAEALCTRCSPILIAAFKVEGDWCAEHGLPESQCLICNPKTGG